MTEIITPLALRPAAVRIENTTLRATPSEAQVRFIPRGVWLSLGRTVWADDEDLERKLIAIATRFGPLTEAGYAPAGEPVQLWLQLIDALKEVSEAWTDTGALADPLASARAHSAGRRVQHQVFAQHQASGGRFEITPFGEWALVCQDTAQWWRLSAIHDLAVYPRSPMQRCRYCGGWFSLAGLRADAGFCSSAHRSAHHQKRPPASDFWAEVL